MIDWLRSLLRRNRATDVIGMVIPPEHLAALRPDDIFLVSFPRSGNTWVRRLIYELVLAENPATPPPEHVDRLLPDLHVHAPSNPAQDAFQVPARILKSHNLRDLKGRRLIYVFRQPGDALVSYFHLRKDLARDAAGTADGLDAFCLRHLDAWVKHVRLALDAAQFPPDRMLFVSYSMLHRDCAGTLRAIADFCGLPSHPETLAQSVERNAFEKLKKTAVPSKPTGSPELFFRRGVEDSARTELESATLERIEAAAGEIYRAACARAEAIPSHGS